MVVEKIVEPESKYSQEVKDIINSMKEENIITRQEGGDVIKDTQVENSTPPISPITTQTHDSDSENDSITFEDDEISLSNFDIEEL